MNDSRYDALKLENQLCFPLYACAREVIRQYKPFLDALDLTYTQYIAMMVLWEQGSASVKELGEKLYLDSGTLTPLLKKMEVKGLITRTRSADDERKLIVSLTPAGEALRERALDVPMKMAQCSTLDAADAAELRLTYTQYIAMMVLWEERCVGVKELGEKLYLDSGTLTPLLKKLETRGLITRERSAEDGRRLIVGLTPAGEALRERAVDVPAKMASCSKLDPADAVALHRILHRMLGSEAQ